MLVKIAGFSQDMDFTDGSITNFVTLELPNGAAVKAIVSDDGARQLIAARAGAGPMAPAPSPPPSHLPSQPQPSFSAEDFADQEEDDHGGAHVFGGNGAADDDEEEGPQAFWPGGDPQVPQGPNGGPTKPSYAHADAATQQRLYQEHQAEQRKKAKRGPTMGRTVPKDDRGNPIVSTGGGVDPNDIMGGGGSGVTDEDGVGQL